MLGLGKMFSCSLFMKFCTKIGPLCQKVSPPSNISAIPGLKPLINAPETVRNTDKRKRKGTTACWRFHCTFQLAKKTVRESSEKIMSSIWSPYE